MSSSLPLEMELWWLSIGERSDAPKSKSAVSSNWLRLKPKSLDQSIALAWLGWCSQGGGAQWVLEDPLVGGGGRHGHCHLATNSYVG